MLSKRASLVTFVLLATAFIPTCRAAEIQLRDQCRVSGTLVRLRDVAVIMAADDGEAARLGAIDLMPAPIPGSERRVRLREIEDVLHSRGVNLTEHRFSGAASVVVLPAHRHAAERPRALPSRLAMRRFQDKVQAAIATHLNEANGRDEPWKIDVHLNDAQVSRLAAMQGDLGAVGGAAPWLGKQRFEIVPLAGSTAPRVSLVADVSLPPTRVIAARSLAPGTLLRASDVRLVRDGNDRRRATGSRSTFHAIDEVVGMETTRSVVAGQQLDATVLRHPLLVRRGDVVTVYARTGGIQVRTTARARDDGSAGELVMIESLRDRKRYFARVTGTREVDVFAESTRVGGPAERERRSAKVAGSRLGATHAVRPGGIVTKQASYGRR